MAIESMKKGAHAFVEVPIAVTIDEMWQIVNTSEQTQKHCMMMENVNYGREELLFLNMCRKEIIGDLLHAEAVGVHAVRYAIKGLNGVMPIIVRSKSEKYSWKIMPAPLSKIANLEKKLPKSFITKDGLNVNKKAIDYLMPLISGENFPEFQNGIPKIEELKLVKVKKKLSKWKP